MNGNHEILNYQRLKEKEEKFLELLEKYRPGARTVINNAYSFACEAHRSQKRKATGEPYVIHCIDVANILMEDNQPSHLVAAGLLHDTVEDFDYTGIMEKDIEEKFGILISGIVMDVTERDKTKPWQERKDAAMEHIKKTSREVKILKCADNLSNIIDMKETRELMGDAMWKMGFRGTKEDHKNNFRKIASALSDISETGIYTKYIAELDEFCRL